MDDHCISIFDFPHGGLAPADISIEISPPSPISPQAQSRIDTHWNAALAQAAAHNRALFTAPILALRSADFSNNTLRLHLTPTDYKTFLITCLRDHDWFTAHAPDAIRPALGNSALLTDSHTALLGVRSPAVSAYANHAHVLGGVLEPLPHNAVNDILTHLRRELAEEAALTAADLAPEPRLLALVRDNTLHQPELIWHWPLLTPIEKIAANLTPPEHHAHLLLPRTAPLENLPHPLTPVARHALTLWQNQ